MHDARRNGHRASAPELAAVVAASIAHDAGEDLEALLLTRVQMGARHRRARHGQQLTHRSVGAVLDHARVLAGDGIVQDRPGGKRRAEVCRREAIDTHAPILSTGPSIRYSRAASRGRRPGNPVARRPAGSASR